MSAPASKPGHTPNPRDMDINSLIAALEGAENGADTLRGELGRLRAENERLRGALIDCADLLTELEKRHYTEPCIALKHARAALGPK